MRIAVLLLATGVLAAQESASVAEWMWADFEALRWQSSMAAWEKAHSGAESRRPDRAGIAEDEFCREYVLRTAGVSSSHFFYAFELEPLACTLLQFRSATPVLSNEATSRVYAELHRRLVGRYGPGRDAGQVHGYCSAFWRHTWAWDTPVSEILLFVNECNGEAKVELLSRHQKLLKTREEDVRLSRIRWETFHEREREFYVSLAETSKTGLPKLKTLLGTTEPLKLDAGTLRAHLRILLTLARTTSNEQKPVLLLLADRLANTLGYFWPAPFDGPHRRHFKEGGFVLTYDWSHLGFGWVYDHALLRRVVCEFAGTEAGEWAFVTLNQRGWFTGAGCPADSALFREVIEKSETFLKLHPDSAYRQEVLFHLAQAYETWWSASQAPPSDSYVQAKDYTAGAEDARKRAIGLYEQILRDTPPESDSSFYARRVLPRLKLGVDTFERRYYCIYD